ncbi:MAG TPA: alpha-galactosidase, partial [Microterricola sp.]
MKAVDGSVVQLRAGGTSIIALVDAGRLPRIVHWGADLGELDAAQLDAIVLSALPAVGDSAVSYPQPVPVLPQLAEGWLG